jgi:3-phenylpropionate/trans-cinnamate dioxygenase ferredoxin subunit
MSLSKVADLENLPVGGSIAVAVDGVPVALVRTDRETVKAVHNVCSHQFYELAPEGWVGDNCIECALHGSVFDLDTGEPESLPALDPIPVYGCMVVDGAVLVDVARPLNSADPPRH